MSADIVNPLAGNPLLVQSFFQPFSTDAVRGIGVAHIDPARLANSSQLPFDHFVVGSEVVNSAQIITGSRGMSADASEESSRRAHTDGLRKIVGLNQGDIPVATLFRNARESLSHTHGILGAAYVFVSTAPRRLWILTDQPDAFGVLKEGIERLVLGARVADALSSTGYYPKSFDHRIKGFGVFTRLPPHKHFMKGPFLDILDMTRGPGAHVVRTFGKEGLFGEWQVPDGQVFATVSLGDMAPLSGGYVIGTVSFLINPDDSLTLLDEIKRHEKSRS